MELTILATIKCQQKNDREGAKKLNEIFENMFVN